jgi:sugar phosphate isomerase/epimerase
MNKQKSSKSMVSRRQFIGTGAAAAAVLSTGALSTGCTSAPVPMATGEGIPNSKFGGVQIGSNTYSFRTPGDFTHTNVDIDYVLQSCVKSGLSSIELRQTAVVEKWCGAPEVISGPRGSGGLSLEMSSMMVGMTEEMRAGWASRVEQGQQKELSEEEKEKNSELEKKAAESQAALKEWRLSASMDKFVELAQMFRDAGVNIHIVKWGPADWSPEEIEYAYKVTEAMGAQGISQEISQEAADIMGPIAEKQGLYAILHNHWQFADPAFDLEPILAVSPSIMLNIDVGHYVGSTGLHPCDLIEKYNDRIFSLHLKDKTGPNTDPPDTNQVWGQGETPLSDILLMVKNKYPHIYCDIELEYPIPAWSNSTKEVRTCVNYARNILT